MILEKLETIIKNRINYVKNYPSQFEHIKEDYIKIYETVLADIAHLMNEEIERDVKIIELESQVERLQNELNNLKNGQNLSPAQKFSNDYENFMGDNI